MKSILLLPITFLLSTIILFAQEENKPKYTKFSFGTELGIMYGTPIGPSDKGSTITVGTAPSTTTITLNDPKGSPGLGLRAGIFTRYKFTDKLAIQLGLAYSVKKANYEAPAYEQYYTIDGFTLGDGTFIPYDPPQITVFNGNVKGEFNNKYLEAPLIVLYKLSDRWKVHGGSYLALLLSGSHKAWATGIVGYNGLPIENEFSDESEFINKWDYGINAGVSYKVFRQIETEFRISTGLRSVFSDDYQLKEETVRNVYLELKANYVFEL